MQYISFYKKRIITINENTVIKSIINNKKL